MKKLALASVAFAAVSAFGAGNSFAQPYVSVSNESLNGTAGVDWTNLGTGPIASSTGGNPVSVIAPVTGFAASVRFSTSNGAADTLGVYQVGSGVNAALPNASYALVSAGIGGTGASHGTFAFALDILPNDRMQVFGIGFNISPVIGCEGGTFNVGVASGCGSGTQMYGGYIAAYSAGGNTLFSTTLASVPFTSTEAIDFAATTAGAIPIASVTGVLYSTGSLNPNFFGDAIGPVTLDAVPEPASLTVLGMGLLGLGALRRRRQKPLAVTQDASRSPSGRWRVVIEPPDTGTA